MDKLGVVVFEKSDNIGDEIQTLAAVKLLPHVDYYLDRENSNEKKGTENIKAIFNGWFLHNPKNWPPAANIHPLFISFHAAHNAQHESPIVTSELIAYYKKFEPIGCRDYGTVKVFERYGIKAYFSGCLTLTLENRFRSRNEKIYCIDPFANIRPQFRERCVDILFPKEIRDIMIFKTHFFDRSTLNLSQKLSLAQEYLDEYAQAKLVVTSRIHCALPCLALGTPVLFIDMGYDEYQDRTRFSGILELMNTLALSSIPYRKNTLTSQIILRLSLDRILMKKQRLKINWDNPPINPVDIMPIAANLRNSVQQFLRLSNQGNEL